MNYDQLASDLPTDDPRRGLPANVEDPFSAATTEAKHTLNPPPKTQGEKELDYYSKKLSGPQSLEDADPDAQGGEVKTEHAKFVKEMQGRGVTYGSPSEQFNQSVAGKGADPEKIPVKAFEFSLTRIRELAEKGGPEGETALGILHAKAMPVLTGQTPDDPEGWFAVIQLHDLTTQENWIKAQRGE